MPPNPSNRPSARVVEHAPSAREAPLTRREWLATLGVGGALCLAAVTLGWWTARRQNPLANDALVPPRELADFALTERSGRTVTRDELRGRFLIVSFLFTSCSLSCGAVNDRMAELQRALAGADDVRLVSLTVDPRTDTPATLARFAARYHADANRWWFLTGDKAELYRLIETSFLTRSRELETLIPGGFANLDHLFLVDRAGRVRQAFGGLRVNAVRQILAALEQLRQETQVP